MHKNLSTLAILMFLLTSAVFPLLGNCGWPYIQLESLLPKESVAVNCVH